MESLLSERLHYLMLPKQIIRYTSEELQELNIMPEDCSYESEQDGTCGYGTPLNHNELFTMSMMESL